MKQIEIIVYPIGTKVYIIANKQVVKAKIKKIEINEFNFANYGVLWDGRKSMVWLKEDDIITDFEEFVIKLRKQFLKVKGSN